MGGRNDKNKLVMLFSKHLKSKNIIGFDVETTGKENTFYMGGLYFPNGSYKSFYDKQKFINEFKKKKYYTNTYIVATNLSFDLTALFYNTPEWNCLDVIMSNGRMISASLLASNNQRLTFIDSFNHAPFSVKVMGEILKIPKLKTPTCLGRLPNNLLEQTELEVYNKRDCEVTQKFMVMLQEGYNTAGGKLKLTIASTSLDVYRRKYLRKVLYKESTKVGFDPKQFIFKSYYGGRTEVFKRGFIDNTYNLYDINSLYPSVMINEYPDPNTVRYTKKGYEELIRTYEGVSEVKLFCPPMRYPLLPVRLNNKLVFPTGIIKGNYTHVEIRNALKLGYQLLSIGETLYYKKTFLPFKEFIIDMYEKRRLLKKDNHPNEIIYKLIMNSSYGKWGSKKLSETIFFNKEHLSNEGIDAIRNNPNVIMKDDNNGMIINNKECDESYVFPIFASYTTAYARIKLHHYLSMYNAVYCDTDSIITNEVLPISDKLGAMKLEYDIIEGIIVKPKMYYLKTRSKEIIKLKGVSKSLIVNNEKIMLNKEIFNTILEGESVTYEKFTKLKEGVRRGILPNTIINVEKKINLIDNKRSWNDYFNKNVLVDSVAFELEEQPNNEELKPCQTLVIT
jgi:hypothetical protein